MKKITLLLILMLALILPSIVLATDGEPSIEIVEMGGAKYISVEAAIEAIKDNTKPTTIKLLVNVDDGEGFVVPSGTNIILDFDGKTYNVTEPLVGSFGTQTNGCQLLKDSNITFKNGTFTSKTASILVQNYADLTLENMKIDATGGIALYALSCNNGKVNITGTTSIIAKEGGVAFDNYYWPDNNYTDGAQITIDTTGTIAGMIELAASNTEGDLPSSLTINNVNFTGSFDVRDDRFYNKVSITGGNFNEIPPEKFIAEGYRCVDHFVRKEHEIKIEAPNGTVTTSVNKAIKGELVVFDVIASEGYVYNGENDILVLDSNGNTIDLDTSNAFYMPDGPVTIKVTFAKKHEIKIESPNGIVKTEVRNEEVNKAAKGETVVISVQPTEGYDLKNILVQDLNGNPVKMEDNNLAFVMPDGPVTVKVTFNKLYKITINSTEEIEIYAPMSAMPGEIIYIDAYSMIEGYDIKSIIVKNSNNVEVKYDKNMIEITMPESDITISAVHGKVTQEVGKLPSHLDETTEVEKNLLASLQELIENLEDGNDNEAFIAGRLKNESVTVEVEVKDKEVKDSEKEKIEKAIEKEIEGIKIGKYIDITIAVKNKNYPEYTIVELEELQEEITFTVAIPEKLQDVEKGYKREYYIVRNHHGAIDILNAILSEDGKSLDFNSNLFSTYAIAYKDIKVEDVKDEETNSTTTQTPAPTTPEISTTPATQGQTQGQTNKENVAIGPVTGDDITIYVTSLIISIMGIVVLRKLNTSKKH